MSGRSKGESEDVAFPERVCYPRGLWPFFTYFLWLTNVLQDVGAMKNLVKEVSMTAEMKSYLQNVVVFLRMHRAVGGGVSPVATRHFDLLVR